MELDLRDAMHRLGDDPATASATHLPLPALTARLRRRRAAHRVAVVTVGTATAAGLVVAGAAGLETYGRPGPAPVEVAASPSPAAERTAEPTAEPTPTPTPVPVPVPVEPSPTPTPAPAEEVTPPTSPVLHGGGRIDDLPEDAPEADVVAHLTRLLGVAPRVEELDQLCPTTIGAGRELSWDGFTLRVATTDRDGLPVAPVVVGWSLSAPAEGGTGLATAEGLRLGDPEAQVLALYPEAEGGEWVEPSLGYWIVGDLDSADLVVITRDDGEGRVVTSVDSGRSCGE